MTNESEKRYGPSADFVPFGVFVPHGAPMPPDAPVYIRPDFDDARTLAGRGLYTHELAEPEAIIAETLGQREWDGPLGSLARVAPGKPIIAVVPGAARRAGGKEAQQ